MCDARKIVEEYREGYPRYTALLSAHKPYFVCRPFNKLRARLLLLKQDRLDILEKRLEEIDNQEPAPLFLGKSRFDRNEARKEVLAEIETCLEEYGIFSRFHGLFQSTYLNHRSISRAHKSRIESMSCSRKRCAQSSKLGERHRVSGQGGNSISFKSRAGFSCPFG